MTNCAVFVIQQLSNSQVLAYPTEVVLKRYKCSEKCSSIKKYLSHCVNFMAYNHLDSKFCVVRIVVHIVFACLKPLRRHLAQHVNRGDLDIADPDTAQDSTEHQSSHDFDTDITDMQSNEPADNA
jgi:hypothetical protein